MVLAAPALAGEGGKTALKPIYQPPVKQQVTTQSYSSTSYTTSHTVNDGRTTYLNQQENSRLLASPPPPPRTVVYQSGPTCGTTYTYSQGSVCGTAAPRPAPAPCGSPCYTQAPAPRPMPAPTPVAAPCYSPCYTAAPAPRPMPAPPAPCYNPCYNQQQPVTYVPAPPPPPQAPYPPTWVHVESCGDKIIDRISDTRDGQRRYEVCFSDLLHLSDIDRNAILLDRIDIATGKACRDTSSVLYSIRSKRNCEEDTMERAVYEANVPGLVEAYNRKTGKRTPTVDVGRPIYY